MIRGLGFGAPVIAVAGALLAILYPRAPSVPPLPDGVWELASARVTMPSPPVTPHPRVFPQARPDTVFRHDQHRSIACLSCHSVDPSHGDLRVRTLADCRSCHHAPRTAGDCTSCHDPSDAPAESFALLRALVLSTGTAPERTLPFTHLQHAEVACGTCHTEGLALSASNVTCGGCHVEHHRPEARCATCHVAVLEPPHEVEVHLGCAGAGCHSTPGFAVMPRSRVSCVACHQTEEEHKPGRECTVCHLLPPPRPPGGRE